jgi:hypothetical protein
VDPVQNFLWTGGDRGITRIRLLRNTHDNPKLNSDFIFPNPYSLKKHETLSIPSYSQNSFVDIYTVSGKLVKHIDESSAEWVNCIAGTCIKWRVPQNIAPGNYIVAVKSYESNKILSKNTKLFKLVVIP